MAKMDAQVRRGSGIGASPAIRTYLRHASRTALEARGMGIAFDPRRARFDTIHPPPPEIHVSDVLHRAFVQVNEAGTEAAALTGLIACFSSEQIQKPPRTFRMVVDRPFFFAITENRTRSILFMGSVEQP